MKKLVMKSFKKRMIKYYSGIDNLYKIMPTLTHKEYREKFAELFDIIHNLGQYLVFVNTGRIEEREFEIFGKRWNE